MYRPYTTSHKHAMTKLGGDTKKLSGLVAQTDGTRCGRYSSYIPHGWVEVGGGGPVHARREVECLAVSAPSPSIPPNTHVCDAVAWKRCTNRSTRCTRSARDPRASGSFGQPRQPLTHLSVFQGRVSRIGLVRATIDAVRSRAHHRLHIPGPVLCVLCVRARFGARVLGRGKVRVVRACVRVRVCGEVARCRDHASSSCVVAHRR